HSCFSLKKYAPSLGRSTTTTLDPSASNISQISEGIPVYANAATANEDNDELRGFRRKKSAMTAGKCKSSTISSALLSRRFLLDTRIHTVTSFENVCELLTSVTVVTRFVCTRLRSKFDTYPSLHIAVDYDKLEVISEAEL
ncbi:MAG: hypothetical protein O7D30_07990, partial [Rickettsia endosymbiont of Ixodes persulcatus]|nr:hypothetical protein [Rickettsia endosymbiont of Ixodes persulcatus]